jgi:putative mRNA 3-end processing factor
MASNHGSNLHGTALVAGLSEMMWKDTYKISKIEGYPLPWDRRDIDEALAAWITHPMRDKFSVQDWDIEYHFAGHVPGAVMMELEIADRKVLFTGDMDTRDSPTTIGAKPVKADVLFMEATYAGREHPPKEEEQQRLVNSVIETVENGGTALIPTFANGRCQDVISLLHESGLDLEGMGKVITKIMLEHPELLAAPAKLDSAFRWTRRVSSKSDRKKALEADVIVTTSGMLDGGPALWYLNRLRHDERNSIFLTGYQAEGSGGHRLLESGALPIFGRMTEIGLSIEQFDLSNHAGHSDLMQFALETEAEEVILYHSDPTTNRPELADALSAQGIHVHQPLNGETHVIE